MSNELKIAADRADHYSGIARSISGISSRIAGLDQSFRIEAPRTPGDDAWLDMLIVTAGGLVATAQALKQVEYVDPSTVPSE
jgi:hypothetical protein